MHTGIGPAASSLAENINSFWATNMISTQGVSVANSNWELSLDSSEVLHYGNNLRLKSHHNPHRINFALRHLLTKTASLSHI